MDKAKKKNECLSLDLTKSDKTPFIMCQGCQAVPFCAKFCMKKHLKRHVLECKKLKKSIQ